MKQLAFAVILAATAASVFADVPGRITKLGDNGESGQAIVGNILWKPMAKKYIVTQKNGVEVEIAYDEVAKVETQRPKELDAAVKAVKDGKYAAAIPVLEKIAKDYAMLQWDEPAARYLAESYVAVDRAADAVKVCEQVISLNPKAAYMGDMAMSYWTALLKTGKSAKLEDLIEKAARSGERATAAKALVMRGDILADKKQYKEALEDGYLRVIVLYKNVKDVQPEAIYKAMQAFEAIQQVPYAEKMRSLLRSDYPSSDYAKKL